MAERPAPTVTITVAFGGLTLERTVAWRARGRTRRAMVAELEAALVAHEALRPHSWNDDDARGPRRPITGIVGITGPT